MSCFFIAEQLVAVAVAAVVICSATLGVGTPVVMTAIAYIGITTGVLTGINGIATIVESANKDEYNLIRDGLFNNVLGLEDSAYYIYEEATKYTAIIATTICGIYQQTGRFKASKQAEEFLGKGYTQEGQNRWVSEDGLRQVRPDCHDPYGTHFNLETFRNPISPGVRNKLIDNVHLVYDWFRAWIAG